MKHLRIGSFTKRCCFWKKNLNSNQKFQSNVWLISIPIALLDYAVALGYQIALLSNKSALLLKGRAFPSSIWFILNKLLLNFSIFCLKCFYHILHICFLMYDIQRPTHYKVSMLTVKKVIKAICTWCVENKTSLDCMNSIF